MSGSLEVTDQMSQDVQKTPFRVSLEMIKERIDSVQYINPEAADYMTLAVMVMTNGYVVVGKSAPADPSNFDKELGRKFAYEDAIRQVWPLMGFQMREELHRMKLTRTTTDETIEAERN